MPEQEPVVEGAGVIEAVFVADQRAGHAAQLQELVPVGGVAGQPGAFQAEDDPGPAQGHLGDQLLEPFPVGGGGAGLALVDVDHGDLVGGPAQRDRPAAQVVLADRGLGVVEDLLEVDWRTYSRAVLDRWAAVTFDEAVSVNTGAPSPGGAVAGWSGACQRDGEPGQGVDELGGHRPGQRPRRPGRQ